MQIDIEYLKSKILSSNINDSLKGIDLSTKLVNDIINSVLISFEKSTNHFVVTEKMSLLFDDFFKGLIKFVDSGNQENSFWAATLLVHYNVRNQKAEEILLNEIINGPQEKAYTSTTILVRQKNYNVVAYIKERLKKQELPLAERHFFIEKLEQMGSASNGSASN